WMSPEFQTRFSLLPTCLKAKSNIALSHDNLFHSVLGMLDVTTQDYTSDLDIFATCKSDTMVAKQ
ncbi:MAG: phosphatidylethanolamine--Kdo2-lipid A phosphoethanolamine transferase, partial [Paracoccaceae bacterium]|nr:phosphatidylethanolamine--Kdo2-lipid A phosphoethanolamine transferase [Paracoccaceae bacterium]